MLDTQRLDGEFTFVNWVAPCPARPCAARRVRSVALRLCLSLVAPRPAPLCGRSAAARVSLGAWLCACPSFAAAPSHVWLRLAPPPLRSRARRPPARFGVAVRLRGFGCSAVSRSRSPCGRVPPPQGHVGRHSLAPYCCGRCRPLAALLDGSLSLVFAPAALAPLLTAYTSAFLAPPLFPVKKA